jgi:hypothetical protein
MKTTINSHRKHKSHRLNGQPFVFISAFLFVLGSALFMGCGNSSEQNNESVQEHAQHAEYKCPMDCEKGKTYKEPGICPVCKMDLTEIKD